MLSKLFKTINLKMLISKFKMTNFMSIIKFWKSAFKNFKESISKLSKMKDNYFKSYSNIESIIKKLFNKLIR